jgi:hypothetical protein
VPVHGFPRRNASGHRLDTTLLPHSSTQTCQCLCRKAHHSLLIIPLHYARLLDTQDQNLHQLATRPPCQETGDLLFLPSALLSVKSNLRVSSSRSPRNSGVVRVNPSSTGSSESSEVPLELAVHRMSHADEWSILTVVHRQEKNGGLGHLTGLENSVVFSRPLHAGG